MQHYRCKCGNSVHHTSMGVPPCSRCGKCGSNHAQGPTGHHDPSPHRLVTKYDQNTGVPYQICADCLMRETELVKRGEADPWPGENAAVIAAAGAS